MHTAVQGDDSSARGAVSRQSGRQPPPPRWRGSGLPLTLLACVPIALHYGAGWARHAQLSRWPEGLAAPSFWGADPNAWTWALLGIAAAAMLLVKSTLGADTKINLLILAAAAGLLVEAMAVRSYYGIVDGAVLLHPAEPWNPDIRFRLADATVTARGCATVSRRHGHRADAIFRVRAPAEAGGAVVDLGNDVDSGNAAQWLAAMRRYSDGTLPLPPGSTEGVLHDASCIRSLTRALDKEGTARFQHLLE